MMLHDYLERRGAATHLAREIGVTHSAVFQWLHKGVPAGRVLAVERATGISRHVLRPDIFGPAAEQAAVSAEPERRRSLPADDEL